MTKVNMLLLLAVIASALVLIRNVYDARRLFSAIHKVESESQRLEGDHKRLEAERQAQATNLRVERTARERLAMRTTTPAVTMYVVDPGTHNAPESNAANNAANNASSAAPAIGVAR